MSSAKYQVRERNPEVKAKKLRREQIVPGILYGQGYEKPLMIEMDRNELTRLLRENSYSSMIPLGGLDKETTVILKEVQRDFLQVNPIHFDFQAISKGQIMTLAVQVRVIGEENIKDAELFVQLELGEINLKGKIEDIPEYVEVDVSEFEIGDRLVVSDIALPEDMEVMEEPDAVVVIAQHVPKAEEEVEDEMVEDGEVAETTEVAEEEAPAEEEEE